MSALAPCPHPAICGVSEGHYPDKGALAACRRRGERARSGTAGATLALASGEQLDPGTTRYLDVYATIEDVEMIEDQDRYRISFESAASDQEWQAEFSQPAGLPAPDAKKLVHHYIDQGSTEMGDLLADDLIGVSAEVASAVDSSTAKDDQLQLAHTGDARQEATIEAMMALHGLDGWVMKWDEKAMARGGICRYETQTLGFSKKVFQLLDAQTARDVVLHEIAHAKVGSDHGHDDTWRQMHLSLGGTGQEKLNRPGLALAIERTKPWWGTCARGHEFYEARPPKKVSDCPACSRWKGSGSLDPEAFITWTKRGKEVAPEDLSKDYARSHWIYERKYELIEAPEQEIKLAKLLQV